ncbi:LOW QUALITY PROTEIN: scavenger receptor cysteine-rich type 1 protein M130-like [Thalassophryne amazonica]|uniref:LOW QUALITY PROTEIN: scavenger receptor cysteine-rich type 1 protein M130-like n=1 Tax=Thalassophryne amazonica TaxID=390379 RepID=UPI0014709B6C|nr:LOW QUALITY PROTEIN: scavenger receptor cysteine-rich type 1 protein M130-like [Thalassophryne amazonica]
MSLCSDPVRLVGGASRCAGTLEMKVQEEWRPVDDCTVPEDSRDSVRLVNGSSLCSGRLEVKWNQSWSSVCEDDFDQQDAQVVCRELGCGPPVVLQGALYGDVAAPKWTKEFQCGGKESGLLACGSSGSDRNTCSPAKAVGLTCSEPFRLAGGASRCAGTLEVKVQEDWRPVDDGGRNWSLKTAGVVCQHLDCGSAVYTNRTYFASNRPAWRTTSVCVQAGSALRDCGTSVSSSYSHQITCSDLLVQPSISLYSTVGGASEVHQQEFQVFRGSPFTVSCSIQPQYPGGSFQLIFTSTNTTWNSTKPAVNHSALFPHPAADYTHQGNYSCVYHIHVFSHNFSSESHLVSLAVSDQTVAVIRLVVGMLLTLLMVIISTCFCRKKAVRQVNTEEGPAEEEEEVQQPQ